MIWTLDHIASYIARTKLGQIATQKHFSKKSFDRLTALYSKSTRIAKSCWLRRTGQKPLNPVHQSFPLPMVSATQEPGYYETCFCILISMHGQPKGENLL